MKYLKIFLALFICFAGNAFAEPLVTENFVKNIGPLEINGKNFRLVLNIRKIVKPAAAFNETVESFEIIDDLGKSYYNRKFQVHLGPNGFKEELSVNAYVLQGENYQGLILYYASEPSAPNGGRSCQIFAQEQGTRFRPLSLPITCYGKILDLLPATSAMSRKLSKDDIIKFAVWTGSFGVIVPCVVNWKEWSVTPAVSWKGFSVEADKRPSSEGRIQLFTKPNPSAPKTQVQVRMNSEIGLIKANGKVSMHTIESPSPMLNIEVTDPWLKVKVDDTEGWLRDWRDLTTIGLPAAG